jgi:hypothetical protein
MEEEGKELVPERSRYTGSRELINRIAIRSKELTSRNARGSMGLIRSK